MNVPLDLEKIIEPENPMKEAALTALQEVLRAKSYVSAMEVKSARIDILAYQERELRYRLMEEGKPLVAISKEPTSDLIRMEVSAVILHPKIARYLHILFNDMEKEIATLKKQLEDVRESKSL